MAHGWHKLCKNLKQGATPGHIAARRWNIAAAALKPMVGHGHGPFVCRVDAQRVERERGSGALLISKNVLKLEFHNIKINLNWRCFYDGNKTSVVMQCAADTWRCTL